MTMTRSQIERLGARLVRSDPPETEDLAVLHELLLAYGDALAEAVDLVQSALGITPSSRVKTTSTILEKLERYGGSWLKTIQDLAGMRIVGRFDRRGQDALVTRLVELFQGGARSPKVVDRRTTPSHGYRAVHAIVFVRTLPVEIQVRTPLQHEWADLFEKLADRVGRGIRYGEPPDHWLTIAERAALSADARASYDVVYRVRRTTVKVAQAVAAAISGYEVDETVNPNDPALPEYRTSIDDALATLTGMLDRISFSGRPF